jgi:hypothetical protein
MQHRANMGAHVLAFACDQQCTEQRALLLPGGEIVGMIEQQPGGLRFIEIT